MFTNTKVLHHLGEELHNLNKLNNNAENNLSSIQKDILIGVDIIYGQLIRMSNHLEPKMTDIYGIFLIQQCNSS